MIVINASHILKNIKSIPYKNTNWPTSCFAFVNTVFMTMTMLNVEYSLINFLCVEIKLKVCEVSSIHFDGHFAA